MNSNEPRYKRESGQPFEEGEACYRLQNNELERSDSPGSKGTADNERNVRNLRELVWIRLAAGAVVEKRGWESITIDVPDQWSEGGIVVMKRGNARGAKAPCQ